MSAAQGGVGEENAWNMSCTACSLGQGCGEACMVFSWEPSAPGHFRSCTALLLKVEKYIKFICTIQFSTRSRSCQNLPFLLNYA